MPHGESFRGNVTNQVGALAGWLPQRHFGMSKLIEAAFVVLLSGSFASAQTDIGCQPRRFGKFSEWSQPVSLGPVVNSANADRWPAISPNGLSLYFSSNRPGGSGNQDIYVTRRANLDAPWGTPRNLGPTINSPVRDNSPSMSRDGHWLIFSSERVVTDGCAGHGTNGFYVSYRGNTEDDFAWEPPVILDCQLAGDEEHVGLTSFHDEFTGMTTYYFQSTKSGGLGSFDYYKSTRGLNGGFSKPVPVPELNTPLVDSSATVRTDGLEMILSYNFTTPLLDGDLWVSTRETTLQPWSTPRSLGPMLNTADDESFMVLSCDATTLFFASNRPGGLGAGSDLYFTTRRPLDDAAPMLLSLSGDGKGQGAILHAGTTQAATSTNAAISGEALEIYATGLGATSSVTVPHVSIGGRRAEILFYGNSPGFIGLNQVNVRVPAGVAPGPAVPVRLTHFGLPSNEVTIGVR